MYVVIAAFDAPAATALQCCCCGILISISFHTKINVKMSVWWCSMLFQALKRARAISCLFGSFAKLPAQFEWLTWDRVRVRMCVCVSCDIGSSFSFFPVFVLFRLNASNVRKMIFFDSATKSLHAANITPSNGMKKLLAKVETIARNKQNSRNGIFGEWNRWTNEHERAEKN